MFYIACHKSVIPRSHINQHGLIHQNYGTCITHKFHYITLIQINLWYKVLLIISIRYRTLESICNNLLLKHKTLQFRLPEIYLHKYMYN